MRPACEDEAAGGVFFADLDRLSRGAGSDGEKEGMGETVDSEISGMCRYGAVHLALGQVGEDAIDGRVLGIGPDRSDDAPLPVLLATDDPLAGALDVQFGRGIGGKRQQVGDPLLRPLLTLAAPHLHQVDVNTQHRKQCREDPGVHREAAFPGFHLGHVATWSAGASGR
jgi:hypothetical protein